MERQFGIKRSFHCEDLLSITNIVGLDQHSPVGDEARRPKRRRTNSIASSFFDEGETWSTESTPSAASEKVLTPTRPFYHNELSPTSQVAVVAPLLAPPCFPSLGARTADEGGARPATAALERFVRQEMRPNDLGFSLSFEEDRDDEGPSCQAWPQFDHQDYLSSPCRIEDFPWPERRVPPAPETPSSSYLRDSADGDWFAPLPLTGLTADAICPKTAPTVNQIAEALSRL